jgi:hypothetical protein
VIRFPSSRIISVVHSERAVFGLVGEVQHLPALSGLLHPEECKDRRNYIHGMKEEKANGTKSCRKAESARDENAALVR